MGILDQPKATHKIHNHSFSSHHWNQSLCRRLGFVDLRARKKKRRNQNTVNEQVHERYPIMQEKYQNGTPVCLRPAGILSYCDY